MNELNDSKAAAPTVITVKELYPSSSLLTLNLEISPSISGDGSDEPIRTDDFRDKPEILNNENIPSLAILSIRESNSTQNDVSESKYY